MTLLPSLDRGALSTADLAYMETPGPPADRVQAAIRAYLWSLEIAETEGRHPSLNMLREALAEQRTWDERTKP